MKPSHHVVISGGVSAIFALWVKQPAAILTCFLSGIFIDLDHHLDYMMVRKELPLNYKKFFDYFDNNRHPRIYLVFHSYEVIILIWAVIAAVSPGPVWLGLAVGVTTHIACDTLANPFKPVAYFLTYRIKHRFERKNLVKEG